MRNYIEKNIKQPAQAYIKAKYDEANAAFDAETFIGNSVQGIINDRTRAKNCFIMGNVVLKGNAKMLECVVAKNAKVVLEDGAIAYKCMFGGYIDNADVPVEFHIGKDSVVYESSLMMSLRLGENSGMIISCMFTKELKCYMDAPPVFTFGKQSLIVNALLGLRPPGAADKPAQQPEYTFGNRTVMIKNHITMRDVVVRTGDDNTFGSYHTMLTACIKGINEVVKPAYVHPAHPSVSDPLGGNMAGDMSQIQRFNINTIMGNRCTIACCVNITAEPKEEQKATATFDDEFICVYSGSPSSQPVMDTGYGITITSSNVSFAEGSTIVVTEPGGSVAYSAIAIGEGATVLWENQKREAVHTALPTSIRIAPYAIVRI